MNRHLLTGAIEGWLTAGRTVLLMKSMDKGAVPRDYRLITCLPTNFKLIIAITAEEVQKHDTYDLMPKEQKGHRR